MFTKEQRSAHNQHNPAGHATDLGVGGGVGGIVGTGGGIDGNARNLHEGIITGGKKEDKMMMMRMMMGQDTG